MESYKIKRNVMILLFTIQYFSLVSSDGINIDLSPYHPNHETGSIFKNHYVLSEDRTKVDIENIDDDVGFLVIQVHSYIENVTLSNSSKLFPHSYVTGTNIGLVWGSEESSATFYIIRNIKFQPNISVLLVVTVYNQADPVPGGCNLTLDTVIAPYQVISYNDEYITVKSQPPSAYGVSCDDNKIQVDMYHLYLPEYDNKDTTYFYGIEKMITVHDIKKFGKKVPEGQEYFKYKRLYSSYRGTGEVFAIIASYKNRSSAYVPGVSFGCDLVNWEHSCEGPVTDHWKFLCAALLIFGIFVCFMGHKCFRFNLYIIGFTFGIFVTYFSISLEDNFSSKEKAITSLITGFFYGIAWLFIWWKFGVPLLSVHLAFLLSGFLMASIVFYAGVADIAGFTNEINFWTCFVSIMLLCLIIWIPFTMHSHIFACSFLGSYACITALNYYIGGNLQYIIINTYRRVTVQHFNHAVIDPPYQTIDIAQSILWLILIIFGVFVQLRDQKGKPPFPPNRNGVVLAEVPTERTRLIRPETVAAPEYV